MEISLLLLLLPLCCVCSARPRARVWGEVQMQGGSCAGLGSQGCTCNSFIYTHNHFTTSGQSFIPCLGRFGLQRDISTKASGKSERALYVKAALLIAVLFPLFGLREVSVPPCPGCPEQWLWLGSCAREPLLLPLLQGDAEGALELPWPCSCAKAELASVLFGFPALNTCWKVLPRSSAGGDGAGPARSGPGGSVALGKHQIQQPQMDPGHPRSSWGCRAPSRPWK